MYKYFIFLFLFISGASAHAQNTTNNPYSYYGLGLYEHSTNALQLALGGIGYGFVDSAYNNKLNSASMSYLAVGQPIFNIDVTGRLSTFTSDVTSSNSRLAYLSGIQFTVPFANRYGLGFGYRPIFSKGYRFIEGQELDGDSLTRIYQGNGGVQQAFLAFSVAPIKNERTFLSFGLEANFNFGDATDVRAIEFKNFSQNNAANVINDRIRGFSYTFSTLFKHELTENTSFSLGASYSPASTWRVTNTDELLRYAGNYGVTHQFVETISSMGTRKGNISSPSIFGLGFGVNLHPMGYQLNSKIQSRIRIHGDLEMTGWSNHTRTINNVIDTNFTFSNTTAYRFGIEYTPHYMASDRSPGLGYFSKISYRAGLNLNQISLPTGNLNDFGITFGFGFPIPFDNSQSSINFGMRIGRVGEVGANTIQEQYIAYQVGIVLTPAKWERWFRKIKYD